MKKFLTLLLFFSLTFIPPAFTKAQTKAETKTSINISTQTANIPPSGYTVEEFHSRINVNQDTSLQVTETIKVNFLQSKHGIFRIIPVIYSAKGKTIRPKLNIVSITDERSSPYHYEVTPYNQSLKINPSTSSGLILSEAERIKIGDPAKTITGPYTYIIKYTLNKVLLRYPDYDEVYWNVTGSEWDTPIQKASVQLDSPFALITKAACYSGRAGTTSQNCQKSFNPKQAFFISDRPISWGDDFTIVVGLDKQNQLKFPGFIERLFIFFLDNWGYPVALLPLFLMFLAWYTKGRDLRYLSENIYLKPKDQKTKNLPLFSREHLPMVYSPINSLSPAQVGTILAQKTDIQDVVAEICELARLGYISIKKIEVKKSPSIFRQGKKIDYVFNKKEKGEKPLKNYQKHLFHSLFDGSQQSVYLSELKNKFYVHLNDFQSKLYDSLIKEKIFPAHPQTTKILWGIIYFVLLVPAFILSVFFAGTTFNSGPITLNFLSLIPAVFLIVSMPRRTAWGHSLFRQITGLRWYLEKGKWREEIFEKNLFFEEILPLAVSLGIIHQLAKDMAVLDAPPPTYFVGTTTASFPSDFSHFSSRASSNFTSSPASASSSHWSGHSGWSGGSGFSSGSSGGGFGGGGGGSW